MDLDVYHCIGSGFVMIEIIMRFQCLESEKFLE